MKLHRKKNRSETEAKSTLKLSRKIGYSIGHANNDLRAVFQLSYVIIYFKLAIGLEPNYGGYYFVATQIVDCIMNPIVGLFQDKSGCVNIFGKRLTWYIAGVVISTLSFGILFNVNFGQMDDSQLQKLLYYIPCGILIACGFTLIQLTHLALLPEMTSLEIERIQINSWRWWCPFKLPRSLECNKKLLYGDKVGYFKHCEPDGSQAEVFRNATTLVCSLLVYCGAWLLFSIQTGDNDVSKLTSKDVDKFKLLSQIIVGLDLFTSLMFLVLVRDKAVTCWQTKTETTINNTGDSSGTNAPRMADVDSSVNSDHISNSPNVVETISYCKIQTNSNIKNEKHESVNIETVGETLDIAVNQAPDNMEVEIDEIKKSELKEVTKRRWLITLLKDGVFYEVTIIYSCAKFGILMTQLYLPLYITETLQMDKVAIGIIPLILYVSGFVSSLLMKRLNSRYGYKKIFIFGEILTLSSCVWIFFITPSSHQQIYAACVLFGSGQAALNVTSVAMVTDLIGQHVDNSGSVFGIIGFSEKLLQSIFLLIVQLWNVCGQNTETTTCGNFFRIVLVSASGITAIIAFIVMAIRQIRNTNSKDFEVKEATTQQQNDQIGEEITHL